jgi:hypothetical protein
MPVSVLVGNGVWLVSLFIGASPWGVFDKSVRRPLPAPDPL